jgi:hypothetical protein
VSSGGAESAERLGPSPSGRRAEAGGAELLACSAVRALGRSPDGRTADGGRRTVAAARRRGSGPRAERTADNRQSPEPQTVPRLEAGGWGPAAAAARLGEALAAAADRRT